MFKTGKSVVVCCKKKQKDHVPVAESSNQRETEELWGYEVRMPWAKHHLLQKCKIILKYLIVFVQVISRGQPAYRSTEGRKKRKSILLEEISVKGWAAERRSQICYCVTLWCANMQINDLRGYHTRTSWGHLFISFHHFLFSYSAFLFFLRTLVLPLICISLRWDDHTKYLY